MAGLICAVAVLVNAVNSLGRYETVRAVKLGWNFQGVLEELVWKHKINQLEEPPSAPVDFSTLQIDWSDPNLDEQKIGLAEGAVKHMTTTKFTKENGFETRYTYDVGDWQESRKVKLAGDGGSRPVSSESLFSSIVKHKREHHRINRGVFEYWCDVESDMNVVEGEGRGGKKRIAITAAQYDYIYAKKGQPFRLVDNQVLIE